MLLKSTARTLSIFAHTGTLALGLTAVPPAARPPVEEAQLQRPMVFTVRTLQPPIVPDVSTLRSDPFGVKYRNLAATVAIGEPDGDLVATDATLGSNVVVAGVPCCCIGGLLLMTDTFGTEVPVEPPPRHESAILRSALLRAGVEVPVPTKLVDFAPRYPAIARAGHIEGAVVLDATIDESGRVEDLRVLRSVAGLDRAAVDAVRRWRYAPATINGLPTRVMLTVTASFRL
jgi:TonB family protein